MTTVRALCNATSAAFYIPDVPSYAAALVRARRTCCNSFRCGAWLAAGFDIDAWRKERKNEQSDEV